MWVPQFMDIHQWMLKGLTCEDSMGTQIFSVLLWKLWGAPNQMVFKHRPINPITVAQEAMSYVQEFNSILPNASGREIQILNQNQHPPVIEENIINIDAGCFSNGSTGRGLVAYDCIDSISFAACRRENISTDPILAEALGVRWSLQLAKDHHMLKVIIASDVAVVVNCINSKSYVAAIDPIIQDCKMLMSEC